MTTNQKKLLEILGNKYHLEMVDGEECICRDVGNYSIEISGTATSQRPYTVFLWLKNGKGQFGEIIARCHDIKGEEQLLSTLDTFLDRIRENLVL